MAYVQGTKVRITATITDSNTGLPIIAPTLSCRVRNPDDTVTDLSNQIQGGGAGVFYAIVDTSAQDGVYAYQFGTSGADAVVERSSFNVRRAIPAV